MKKVKIILSLVSLFLLSGCASLQYKNLAQYNVILNCQKVNVLDKKSNSNKVLTQSANFGFNTKDGRMVYDINQNGEYQYAQYKNKISEKVLYDSISEEVMLVIGSAQGQTYVSASYANATYTFFECTKR